MTPNPRNLALMTSPFLSAAPPAAVSATDPPVADTSAGAAPSAPADFCKSPDNCILLHPKWGPCATCIPSSDGPADCAQSVGEERKATQAVISKAAFPGSSPGADVAGSSETFRIPPGFVLVERELLGRVVKRLRQASERERQELLEPLPIFLNN